VIELKKGTIPVEEKAIVNPLQTTGMKYYVVIGLLASVVGIGLFAYITQLTQGLEVTGMRNRVMWGIYVTNFVYFIAISMAGTLISAILRLTNAGWRKPITRIAESITVVSLIFAGSSIVFDLGRPDRMGHMLLFGRLDSPLIWDLFSLTSYLIGSILYLYLPLIPDIAYLRDSSTGISGIKQWLYKRLSLGWTGSEEQKKKLERAIKVMSVLIIPVAVSIHSVTAWIFGVTLKVGWHSTIFAPYFVSGAVFSGIATIILVAAIFRKAYGLESFLTLRHFKNLAYLMMAGNLIYVYFLVSEFLTMYYGGEPHDLMLLNAFFTGEYAIQFWTFAIAALVLPLIILAVPSGRTILGIVIAAVLANIGMWFARYIIVIPSLSHPFLTEGWNPYTPTWVEISITGLSFAGFALVLAIFAKLFPIISMWEIRGEQEGIASQESQHSIGPVGEIARDGGERAT